MKSSRHTVALFGGSFNPPGEHHRAIARFLSKQFDEVLVVPCGPRPDKSETNGVDPIHRATMTDLCFRGIPRVHVELFDLESPVFTRAHQLDAKFSEKGEIWHVVGADLIVGGATGKSPIQREWEKGKEFWKKARFAVLKRKGVEINPKDLPPHHRVFDMEFEGSSSLIRGQIFQNQMVENSLSENVATYVDRYGLYRGAPPARVTHARLKDVRYKLVVDEKNPQAVKLAKKFTRSTDEDPNLILVIGGDGAMLRTIRRLWRLRIPFYGINAGHLGFLLNPSHVTHVEDRMLAIYHLPLLWVDTEDASGERKQNVAFNDAWVERATGQTGKIELKVNDQLRIEELLADGALVSTAAGSASYARAMGATPVPFNTSVLLLVGSNVLRPINWKSAVLPLEASVELTGLEPDKRPLHGFVDGVPQGVVRKMCVRVSNTASVQLAFEPDYEPAEKLAKLQFPRT